uniref:Uncharacterized protein K02A26 (Trinotate prediction) n=1 Tax=Henneguya salminicola TaxID=69463 RepID=A0A6G3MEG1_HENSL
MWWPGMESEIKDFIKQCDYCQREKNYYPKRAPVHQWWEVERPFERLHIDFATPKQGINYLIIVDAFSKWPEVYPMNQISSQATVRNLRNFVARFGIPEVIVSDNGRQFISEEIQSFFNANNIKHIRTAPFHPAANGLAERFVQSFKRCVTRSNTVTDKEIENFLMAYRSSPHSTTGKSPYQILFKREMRTLLSTIKENKRSPRKEPLKRDENLGDWKSVYVYFKNDNIESWKPGIVTRRNGPVSYEVSIDGKKYKRHIDLLKSLITNTPTTKGEECHFEPRRSQRLKEKNQGQSTLAREKCYK